MIATCIRALPNEGCGLLLGTSDGRVTEVVASENVAASARVYEVDSRVLLKAYRRADAEGLAVLGAFHSHTHSEAYPSPTDIHQAPDPEWHYVLVSLRDVPAVVRSFRIVAETVTEEELSD
jgi:proteasome lid subunit RPN8/RPN11